MFKYSVRQQRRRLARRTSGQLMFDLQMMLDLFEPEQLDQARNRLVALHRMLGEKTSARSYNRHGRGRRRAMNIRFDKLARAGLV